MRHAVSVPDRGEKRLEQFRYSIGLLFLAGLSREDIRERKISFHKLVLFGLGGIFCCCIEGTSSYEVLYRIVPGGLLLLLSVMTKEALGYGDSIAVLVLGLWMGEVFTAFILAIAFWLAGIYGVFCRIKGEKEPLPFIPFLLSGMEVCLACMKN